MQLHASSLSLSRDTLSGVHVTLHVTQCYMENKEYSLAYVSTSNVMNK